MKYLFDTLAYLKKNPLLLLLLAYAILSRSVLLADGVIPFGFDHGKDSIAVMEIVATRSPSLIGPWTSIPGLYFGPGWYYLLAPAFLIGNFNPVAPVVVMVLLLLVQIVLAYRFFGFWAALMISSADVWFMFSTSAWNPFPMTLLTLVILILILHVARKKSIGNWIAFGLATTAAFGFHFSTAYAIFYPIAIGLFIWKNQISFQKKALLWAGVGFALPFAPQMLFELRNEFVQTKAIIKYVTEAGSGQELGLEKIWNVITTVWGQFLSATLPSFRGLPGALTQIIRTVFVLLFIKWFVQLKLWKEEQTRWMLQLTGLFVGLPTLGYFLLHFNVWYAYAMTPVFVVLVAHLVPKLPRVAQIVFGLLLLATPVFVMTDYWSTGRDALSRHQAFLPIKLKVIEEIRTRAGDRPFAVYHYLPDIYDFSYQYLYFYQGFQGKRLPVSMAYEPGVPEYIVGKQQILAEIEKRGVPADTRDPEIVFFVVETPHVDWLLDEWWTRQTYSSILEQVAVGDQMTLYVAQP